MSRATINRISVHDWRGLSPKLDRGRLRFDLNCAQCGTHDEWAAANMVGPDVALKKIEQMGWRTGKRLPCPACNRPAKTKEATVTKAIEASPEAQRKNKRLVIAALEDYFDDTTSRYKDGRSDKAVGDELGIAEAFVAKVREELFWQLAEPDELAEMRGQLAALTAQMAALQKQFNDTCLRNGWRA